MVSSNGIHSKSQLYLIKLSYFHLISGPICLNLPLNVCHYLAPRLSIVTFPLPPLHALFPKHKLSPLCQQTSASLPPRLCLWPFFFSPPVQNVSASPGSSITFIKPSMIPPAGCNHTAPMVPKDFTHASLPEFILTTFSFIIQSFHKSQRIHTEFILQSPWCLI